MTEVQRSLILFKPLVNAELMKTDPEDTVGQRSHLRSIVAEQVRNLSREQLNRRLTVLCHQ